MTSKIDKAIKQYIKNKKQEEKEENENQEKKEELASTIAKNFDDALYSPLFETLEVDDIVYILGFTKITVTTAMELQKKYSENPEDYFKIVCAMHFSEEVSVEDSFQFLDYIKDNGAFTQVKQIQKEYNDLQTKFAELQKEKEEKYQKTVAKYQNYKAKFLSVNKENAENKELIEKLQKEISELKKRDSSNEEVQ